jgi:hypothetical protein
MTFLKKVIGSDKKVIGSDKKVIFKTKKQLYNNYLRHPKTYKILKILKTTTTKH